MMKSLVFFMMLSCAAGAFAQSQEKCFRNDGLRDNHIVRLGADGGDVVGSYLVESDGDAEQTSAFDFSGTRSGKTLTVRFAGDAPPGVVPSNTKDVIWTLAQSADGEVLQITFYGKNYETNSYAYYPAEFVSCEPGFATLAKQAKRISFARGAKSSAVSVSFRNLSERKAFLLGARKGQHFSVVSPGCRISVYYPDKTADQEGGIDTFSLDNLPQSGNYLFVLGPAGEPGNCEATFEINN